MTVTGNAADYTATYTYHPQRNIKQRVENKYGNTLISSYYSTIDELGRRNATITSGSAFVTIPEAFNLYDYNDRSELIESARYEGADIADLTAPITDEYRQYIFDNIGNREEATEAAETGIYTTNSLNQYIDLTKGQQTETFEHDDDGNLISRTADGKTILYSFNGENRLIAIEPQTPQSGDIRVTMMYDYMGRRVEKKAFTHNGTDWTEDYTKHFLYHGWNLVKESSTENSTTSATCYTWGLDLSQSIQGAGGIGGLIATVSDTDTNYHCYDLNGNKTQLISELDGTINAHIEYDPFGNDINSYGLSSADAPFRFSTKYYDAEYDLYYFGYRYYLPELGRWLNKDPLGEEGGLNLYLFVENSSTNQIDKYGLEAYGYPTDFIEFIRKLESSIYNTYNDVKGSIVSGSKETWEGINSVISKGWQKSRKFLQDKAPSLPAVGFQWGGGVIPGAGGFIAGQNAMFFPETCEYSVYNYVNGLWSMKEIKENLSFENGGKTIEAITTMLARSTSVGLYGGVGAEWVTAIPTGSKTHDADSWTQIPHQKKLKFSEAFIRADV